MRDLKDLGEMTDLQRSDGGNTDVMISSLDDDTLAAVLLRVLPRPGLIATPAALAARRAQITCTDQDQVFEPWFHQQLFDGRITKAWRRYLEAAEAPAELARAPLWCRSSEADTVFDDLASQWHDQLHSVCKRWRALLARYAPVTAALCGLQDRPPASTETLVLCWDWTNTSHEDTCLGELDHLAGLPSLRTLVFFNPRQPEMRYSLLNEDKSGLDDGRHYVLAPPPLPANLDLKHLVHFVLRHECKEQAARDEAFLGSIEPLSGLQTLVLPPGLCWPQRYSASSLLLRLPQLRALIAPGSTAVTLRHATHLTALRALSAAVCDDDAPESSEAAVDSQDEDTAHLRDAATCQAGDACEAQLLKTLSAVQSLTLSVGRSPISAGTAMAVFSRFEALSSLTRLSLDIGGQTFTAAMMAQVAKAPALLSLHIRQSLQPRHSLQEVIPFEALSTLTELYADSSVRLRQESVDSLGGLIGLKDLAICVDDDASIVCLHHLMGLTSLAVQKRLLSESDCHVVACLTRLVRLDLTDSNFKDIKSVLNFRPLCRLHALALPFEEAHKVTSIGPALRDLDPACAFPHVTKLDLQQVGGSRINRRTIAALARLRNLRDLGLRSSTINDSTLAAMTTLQELRWLDLGWTRGWTLSGLRRLVGCPRLLLVDLRFYQPATVAEEQDVARVQQHEFPFTLVRMGMGRMVDMMNMDMMNGFEDMIDFTGFEHLFAA